MTIHWQDTEHLRVNSCHRALCALTLDFEDRPYLTMPFLQQ